MLLHASGQDDASTPGSSGKPVNGEHAEIALRTEAFVFCRRNQDVADEGFGIALPARTPTEV
jgi:hypothetical protein